MNTKKHIYASAALFMVGGLAGALPALADTTTSTNTNLPPAARGMMKGGGWGQVGGRPGMPDGRGVAGTVTAVSGSTITLTSRTPLGKPSATSATSVATTVYTVDASKATVTKAGTVSTVSAIAVGDQLLVQGTVTGTNIMATTIHDGVSRGFGIDDKSGLGKGGMRGARASTTPPVITGNGQPVIAGKVTAVSGNALTVTNASNVTYIVDAINARVASHNVLTTLANVKIGDEVVVQGIVNGNSVVALSVIDNATPASTANRPATGAGQPKAKGGFFSGVGNFFGKLFGF